MSYTDFLAEASLSVRPKRKASKKITRPKGKRLDPLYSAVNASMHSICMLACFLLLREHEQTCMHAMNTTKENIHECQQ